MEGRLATRTWLRLDGSGKRIFVRGYFLCDSYEDFRRHNNRIAFGGERLRSDIHHSLGFSQCHIPHLVQPIDLPASVADV